MTTFVIVNWGGYQVWRTEGEKADSWKNTMLKINENVHRNLQDSGGFSQGSQRNFSSTVGIEGSWKVTGVCLLHWHYQKARIWVFKRNKTLNLYGNQIFKQGSKLNFKVENCKVLWNWWVCLFGSLGSHLPKSRDWITPEKKCQEVIPSLPK